MLKNKSDKKIPEFQLSFENILVCNEKKFRPFIEAFVQDPENVEQQNLGTLIGIFEISDISEDSSYIVNYLISIIKKEYFARPRRGPVESFEAALRKANLALSKLAEHGNISWLGKLNVLCAVAEKNKLHLSQTGTASAFLLRARSLTNIGEDSDEKDPEPNPLKSFDAVSSGKLEAGDKLLITTEGIFEIFSFEEIKKSALRFSETEFTRFLRTALGNELERAAVLVIDIKEKPEAPKEVYSTAPARHLNAFSQSAFAKTSRTSAEDAEIKTEIKEELEKAKDEFTNKKTGHIYLKGAEHPPVQKDYFSEIFLFFKDLSVSFKKVLANSGKKSGLAFHGFFSALWQRSSELKITWPKEKITRVGSFMKEKFLSFFPQGSTLDRLKVEHSKPAIVTIAVVSPRPKSAGAMSFPFFKKLKASLEFLPRFSRIKNILNSLSYEQKLYSLLAIVAIFVFPYLGLKISKNIADKKAASLVREVPPVIVPLPQDKNVIRLENMVSVYSGNNILGTIILNGKLFAVAQSEIVSLESGEKISVPGDFGEIKNIAGMNDLNLIFLINPDKKIISFSAVSKKFQDNSISIPENSNIADAKTYLTYIYLLDSKDSQIYRYPRAEGGFGEKINWLKDPLGLSGATGMTINENIFIADGKNILKLFRGKKQDFNPEQSATPLAPYKVHVTEDGANIYVLDKINSRVVKLDGSGNIVAQYYNSEIANAGDLAIDEANNTAYFSTPNAIKSFKMKQL